MLNRAGNLHLSIFVLFLAITPTLQAQKSYLMIFGGGFLATLGSYVGYGCLKVAEQVKLMEQMLPEIERLTKEIEERSPLLTIAEFVAQNPEAAESIHNCCVLVGVSQEQYQEMLLKDLFVKALDKGYKPTVMRKIIRAVYTVAGVAGGVASLGALLVYKGWA